MSRAVDQVAPQVYHMSLALESKLLVCTSEVGGERRSGPSGDQIVFACWCHRPGVSASEYKLQEGNRNAFVRDPFSGIICGRPGARRGAAVAPVGGCWPSMENSHAGGWLLATVSMKTARAVGGCWPAMVKAMVVNSCWPSLETTMLVGGCWPSMERISGCWPTMERTMVVGSSWPNLETAVVVLVFHGSNKSSCVASNQESNPRCYSTSYEVTVQTT